MEMMLLIKSLRYGIFEDGFNSVDEMIKLIELDLSKPNPKFKDE